MSALDLIILVPILPLFPMALFLTPYTKLAHRIPKIILGPYLLYVSFALWHFYREWSVTLLVAAIGVLLIILATAQSADIDDKP